MRNYVCKDTVEKQLAQRNLTKEPSCFIAESESL